MSRVAFLVILVIYFVFSSVLLVCFAVELVHAIGVSDHVGSDVEIGWLVLWTGIRKVWTPIVSAMFEDLVTRAGSFI